MTGLTQGEAQARRGNMFECRDKYCRAHGRYLRRINRLVRTVARLRIENTRLRTRTKLTEDAVGVLQFVADRPTSEYSSNHVVVSIPNYIIEAARRWDG